MCYYCRHMTPLERKLAKVQLFIVGAMVFAIAALAVICPVLLFVMLVVGLWQKFFA